MSRVEVGFALPDDAQFLLEMISLSLQSLPHVASRSPLEIGLMAQLQFAGWNSSQDRAFVARLNGEQAGAAWIKGEGEPGSLQYSLGIAVAPLFRRQGVGTTLLAQVLGFCQENQGKCVNLNVHPGNLAAMRLYRRFGFEEISLEMQLRLD